MAQRILFLVFVNPPVIGLAKRDLARDAHKALMAMAAFAVLADVLTLTAWTGGVHAGIMADKGFEINTYLAIPDLMPQIGSKSLKSGALQAQLAKKTPCQAENTENLPFFRCQIGFLSSTDVRVLLLFSTIYSVAKKALRGLNKVKAGVGRFATATAPGCANGLAGGQSRYLAPRFARPCTDRG